MYEIFKSRCKNAQIGLPILGKIILGHSIDIKDIKTYTKKHIATIYSVAFVYDTRLCARKLERGIRYGR